MFASHKYRPNPKRKSRIKGECEAGLWKGLRWKHGRYFDCARAFDQKYKHLAPGQRGGALGHVALKVYRFLVERTGDQGRLEYSLQSIAELTNSARSAVVHALKILKQFGFVQWINRYVLNENADIFGPQVWQTTNAYAVDIPPDAAALVPLPSDRRPDDDIARKIAMVDQCRTYDAQANGVLDAIDRLGAAIHERLRPPE